MSRCRVRLLALALLITPYWLLSLVATPAHEAQAEATAGFSDADVGVVKDNAKQLKFKDDSTGFE